MAKTSMNRAYTLALTWLNFVMKACLSQSTSISERITKTRGYVVSNTMAHETHRENRVYQTATPDKALGQKSEIRSGHLDHVPKGNHTQHESQLEALHNVCKRRQLCPERRESATSPAHMIWNRFSFSNFLKTASGTFSDAVTSMTIATHSP